MAAVGRKVLAVYGTVEVECDRGLRITIEDAERYVSVPISAEAARELGEILTAFSVVYRDK